MNEGREGPGEIVTDTQARLDHLPWSRFHTLAAVALGVTWILDGLGRKKLFTISVLAHLPATAATAFSWNLRSFLTGMGIGGIAGLWLPGVLIDSGPRVSVFGGYLFGAALTIGAGLIAWRFAIRAERRPLEEVRKPLGVL